MVINHNMSSLFASRQEGINAQALQKKFQEHPLCLRSFE